MHDKLKNNKKRLNLKKSAKHLRKSKKIRIFAANLRDNGRRRKT